MYNRSLLMIYIIYQIFEIVAKTTMIFVINNSNIVAFMVFSIGVDIYILKEFKSFYKLLP